MRVITLVFCLVVSFSGDLNCQSYLDVLRRREIGLLVPDEVQKGFVERECEEMSKKVGEPIEGVYSVSMVEAGTFCGFDVYSEAANYATAVIRKSGGQFRIVWGDIDPQWSQVISMRNGSCSGRDANQPAITFSPTASPLRYTGTFTEVETGVPRGFNAIVTSDGMIQFSFSDSEQMRTDDCQCANSQNGFGRMSEWELSRCLVMSPPNTLTYTLVKLCGTNTAASVSPQKGSASCVVIDARSGVICTNYHVVKEARTKSVKYRGNFYAVDLIAKDESLDLAILKMRSQAPSGLTSLPIGVSCKLGERVYAAGYPKMGDLGESLKITDGVVSSLSFLGDSQRLQVSCPITNGNSGGALLNANGDLVGITQGGYRPDINTENVNGAIKSLNLLMLLQSAGVEPNVNLGGDLNFDDLSNSILPIFVR